VSGERLLDVVGGAVQLQQCDLYAHRVPILNAHHICPESWWLAAGKPVNSPLKNLCPNCHESVHTAIDGILRQLDLAALPPRCVALAQQAFVLADQNGLTPAPTL
jgi:hypothetical protein